MMEKVTQLGKSNILIVCWYPLVRAELFYDTIKSSTMIVSQLPLFVWATHTYPSSYRSNNQITLLSLSLNAD